MQTVPRKKYHCLVLFYSINCGQTERTKALYSNSFSNPLSFLSRLQENFAVHVSFCTDDHEFSTSSASYELPLESISFLLSSSIQIFIDASWKISESWLTRVAICGGTRIKSWFKRERADYPAQAEARALLWATKMAISNGWRRVIFFSDSQKVIASIKRQQATSWIFKNILLDLFANVNSFDSWNGFWILLEVKILLHIT